MDQKHLQKLEDAYLKHLNANLQNQPVVPGGWNWRAYGITSVSAIVIGYRPRKPPTGGMEVVYLVTINSTYSIPNPGQAARERGADGNWCTFVQLAPSVNSGGCVTQFLSTYVGTNPYAARAKARPKAKPSVAARELSPEDGGDGSVPTPPHPPP